MSTREDLLFTGLDDLVDAIDTAEALLRAHVLAVDATYAALGMIPDPLRQQSKSSPHIKPYENL